MKVVKQHIGEIDIKINLFFSVFNFYVTHESSIWKNKNNYTKHELENDIET